jgi:sarcosine oxidase
LAFKPTAPCPYDDHPANDEKDPYLDNRNFDVIVVGLGMAGAATLDALARRGVRALGLERFSAPNDQASHHGDNRIFRLAYAEDASYVPLLQAALAGWRDAEARSGRALLHTTGSVHGGAEASVEFRGALGACREHGIAHEVLDAAELNRRYPGYRLPAEHRVVFQPDGGFVAAEASIETFLELAKSRGATVKEKVAVRSWQVQAGLARVKTDDGQYVADRLVLAAGAWMPDLVPLLREHLRITRQVVAWFQPQEPALFAPGRFPVFTLDTAAGPVFGFPQWQRPGMKIGRHGHRNEETSPGDVRRGLDETDRQVLQAAVSVSFPDAAGAMLSHGVGVYSNTRDEFFILDHHPEHSEVVLASACSGHGFKFMPVIGRVLSDMALDGCSPMDASLAPHRLDRFFRAAPRSRSGAVSTGTSL